MTAAVPAPGCVFRDGALEVALPPRVVRIRVAPEVSAHERWVVGGEWRPCLPVFRILAPPGRWPDGPGLPGPLPAFASPEAVAARREALFAFRASVEAEIAALVEPFASHQFALLDLLARNRAALDLARANPVLAYAVANCHEFRPLRSPTPAAQAAWVLDRRQRQLAGWLGFPGTEATVKLLRKVDPAAANPSSLRMLAAVLRGDPEATRWLAHAPRIGGPLLWLVCKGRMRIILGPALLRELVADTEADAHGLLVEALSCWRELAQRDDRPPRFESLRQVRAYAGAAREVLRRRRLLQERLLRDFPEGTPDIERLATRCELIGESEQQHNCVKSYWPRVRRGAVAIYRVLRPERATLSVRRGGPGYEIGELEAAHCRKVLPETRAAVNAWLADALAALHRQAANG